MAGGGRRQQVDGARTAPLTANEVVSSTRRLLRRPGVDQIASHPCCASAAPPRSTVSAAGGRGRGSAACRRCRGHLASWVRYYGRGEATAARAACRARAPACSPPALSSPILLAARPAWNRRAVAAALGGMMAGVFVSEVDIPPLGSSSEAAGRRCQPSRGVGRGRRARRSSGARHGAIELARSSRDQQRLAHVAAHLPPTTVASAARRGSLVDPFRPSRKRLPADFRPEIDPPGRMRPHGALRPKQRAPREAGGRTGSVARWVAPRRGLVRLRHRQGEHGAKGRNRRFRPFSLPASFRPPQAPRRPISVRDRGSATPAHRAGWPASRAVACWAVGRRRERERYANHYPRSSHDGHCQARARADVEVGITFV